MSYNPFTLEGKTILITGASSGIGRATAIECSKLGATCFITARNEERLNETLSQMEGKGHQMIVADIATQDGIDTLVEQSPAIDGLVNNAGVSYTKPISFIKEEELNRIFSINTFAPIVLTKSILKKKKMNVGGSIVFVSSAASINPDIANSIYSATKAAIASFSRSCAKELSVKQIRSNSVHPGMVETELVKNLIFSAEDLENDKAKYLLKRYGKPEEIAWSIIYLLSDASAWVTGSSVIIDGGLLVK
jgi:NAD(P)-dependent dehydrogenase (short-subunit alcohol dehydrogenase family)